MNSQGGWQQVQESVNSPTRDKSALHPSLGGQGGVLWRLLDVNPRVCAWFPADSMCLVFIFFTCCIHSWQSAVTSDVLM